MVLSFACVADTTRYMWYRVMSTMSMSVMWRAGAYVFVWERSGNLATICVSPSIGYIECHVLGKGASQLGVPIRTVGDLKGLLGDIRVRSVSEGMAY